MSGCLLFLSVVQCCCSEQGAEFWGTGTAGGCEMGWGLLLPWKSLLPGWFLRVLGCPREMGSSGCSGEQYETWQRCLKQDLFLCLGARWKNPIWFCMVLRLGSFIPS